MEHVLPSGSQWFSLPLALLLVGCNSPASPPANGSGPTTASVAARSRIPAKIVCLTPNLTEVLFALGVGDRVVGVTHNDSYPPEVTALPKVGDMTVDWECLVRLRPDWTVLDVELNKDHVQRLQELGLTVRGFHSQSLTGMRQAVAALAADLDLRPTGEKLLHQLDLALSQAHHRASRWPRGPSVFVEIDGEPLRSAGGGTYVDEVVGLAGGINVCRSIPGQYPTVALEKLLQLDPDVVVLTTLNPKDVRSRPGWSKLRAVRLGHVFQISPDLLVRPTLRLPLGIAQLQSWFELAVPGAGL